MNKNKPNMVQAAKSCLPKHHRLHHCQQWIQAWINGEINVVKVQSGQKWSVWCQKKNGPRWSKSTILRLRRLGWTRATNFDLRPDPRHSVLFKMHIQQNSSSMFLGFTLMISIGSFGWLSDYLAIWLTHIILHRASSTSTWSTILLYPCCPFGRFTSSFTWQPSLGDSKPRFTLSTALSRSYESRVVDGFPYLLLLWSASSSQTSIHFTVIPHEPSSFWLTLSNGKNIKEPTLVNVNSSYYRHGLLGRNVEYLWDTVFENPFYFFFLDKCFSDFWGCLPVSPRLPVNPVLQSDLSLVKDTSCVDKLSQRGDSRLMGLMATALMSYISCKVISTWVEISESQSLWFRPTWLQNSTTIGMLIKEVLLDADSQGRIWMSLGYCGIQVFRFRKSTEICMNLWLLAALDRHFFTLLHAFQSLASTRIFPFVALHFHDSTTDASVKQLSLIQNNCFTSFPPKVWFGGPCQQLHSAHPASQTIKCTPPESKE